jgi:tripeptidyl-peptidase-1
MWVNSLVSLLPLVGFAFALPSQDCEHKIKESVSPPLGWTIAGPAPSDHLIKLRIALPQSNFDVLEDHLYAISDPYHERYGAHLTKEEIEELVAPRPESVASVTEWLSSHGVEEDDIGRSPAGDWLTIRVPVRLVEKMLDTASHCRVGPASHILSNNCVFFHHPEISHLEAHWQRRLYCPNHQLQPSEESA